MTVRWAPRCNLLFGGVNSLPTVGAPVALARVVVHRHSDALTVHMRGRCLSLAAGSWVAAYLQRLERPLRSVTLDSVRS
eukprot:COSAG03_NODE_13627_length_495_cov_0.497475_1_plen_78_part_01